MSDYVVNTWGDASEYYTMVFALACKSMMDFIPRHERHRYALVEETLNECSDAFFRECFDLLNHHFTEYGTRPTDSERAFLDLMLDTVFAEPKTEAELRESSELLEWLERVSGQPT